MRFSWVWRSFFPIETQFKILSAQYYKPSEKWTIPYMAEKLNISTGYLHALYQQYFHTTCTKDVISSRIKYACELLVSRNLAISEIAEHCGYSNTEHFIRQFKLSMHTTPGRYQKENVSEREGYLTASQIRFPSCLLPVPLLLCF